MAPMETSDEGVKKNRSGIEAPAPHEEERDEQAYRDSPCLPFLLCHRGILRGHSYRTDAAAPARCYVNGGIFCALRPVLRGREALVYPGSHPPHIVYSASLQPARASARLCRAVCRTKQGRRHGGFFLRFRTRLALAPPEYPNRGQQQESH